MPEKWTVQDTSTRYVGDTPCWQITMAKPDGNTHIHLMPMVSLEWRAAEYGIDPTDVDTLLEILLHEPHMPMTDEDVPRYTGNRPDLWTADNTTAARDAHLARVTECPVRVDVRGSTQLDNVRTGHKPDPARIRAMREAVDTNRWIKKYGDLPVKPNRSALEAPRA